MIYKFKPILKETIWGGDRIAAFKSLDVKEDCIGESWEISGVPGDVSVVSDGPDKGVTLNQLIERDGARLLGHRNFERFGKEFPLLIKFIDARQDLSIQVHPDDALAASRHGCKGKTEMWYVVDAGKDAHLRSGLSQALTPEGYVKAVEEDTILDYLKDYEVAPGDVFFLPAGRIHSIGAGCFIAEIQQTSNITYRIYDFNRTDKNGNKRELHTELAKDAINYEVADDYRTAYSVPENGIATLVDCNYFTTSLACLESGEHVLPEMDSFRILMGLEGEAEVEADGEKKTLRKGETFLIPASVDSLKLLPKGGAAKILISYID